MFREDGTAVFESPVATLGLDTTRDMFLSSPLFPISKPLNQNAPWSRYAFLPVTALGEQLTGNVCFCHGRIYSLQLCSIRPEFESSPDDYSLEKERALHCFHKRFLQDIFGRLPDDFFRSELDDRDTDVGYTFSWGKVRTSTDIKSDSRYIFIGYASETNR